MYLLHNRRSTNITYCCSSLPLAKNWAKRKCVAKDSLDEESPEELKFDGARTKGHRAKVRSVFQEDQPSSVSRMD